jgi:hypothetical protein
MFHKAYSCISSINYEFLLIYVDSQIFQRIITLNANKNFNIHALLRRLDAHKDTDGFRPALEQKHTSAKSVTLKASYE